MAVDLAPDTVVPFPQVQLNLSESIEQLRATKIIKMNEWESKKVEGKNNNDNNNKSTHNNNKTNYNSKKSNTNNKNKRNLNTNKFFWIE